MSHEAAPQATLALSRRRLWQIAAVLAVSASLHVVPQLLSAQVDPALSMNALMVLDALVFAVIARTVASWRVVLLLGTMFFVLAASRRYQIVTLPSIALYLMLSFVFGFTLRAGQTPLIQRIAAHALGEGAIAADFAHYLRGLTLAWCVFFLLMAAAAALLALAAPFAWWSLFANVLSWPLIGAMFVADYLVRRFAFPHLPAHTPLQTIASVLSFPRNALHWH